MRHFFNQKKPLKLSTLDQNKLNGKAVERHIASLLLSAMNARVVFTSRTEDDAKIDLITAFSHPWIDNDVQIISTQVKSGASFCSIDNNTLILKNSKFKDLLKRNSWMLVCWTTTEGKAAYWFLIKPNSKFIKLEYNSNHIINPLAKFHLIRIIYSVTKRDGGKGLIFSRQNHNQEYSRIEYQKLRTFAKQRYKDFKTAKIINPVFGVIEFTRLAWRHITRQTRLDNFKTASFEVIPILDKLMMTAPSKHYTLKHFTDIIDGDVYVENEYLLNYSEVKIYDITTGNTLRAEVFIKLIEVGSYHSDWMSNAEKNNFVSRRVIFKSIYYKQSSQNMHA